MSESKLRLCRVGVDVGYFHCWEQYSEPVPESMMIGGPPAGQYSRVYGIVEFSDGVEHISPEKIIFIDEINANLKEFQKAFEEDKHEQTVDSGSDCGV